MLYCPPSASPLNLAGGVRARLAGAVEENHRWETPHGRSARGHRLRNEGVSGVDHGIAGSGLTRVGCRCLAPQNDGRKRRECGELAGGLGDEVVSWLKKLRVKSDENKLKLAKDRLEAAARISSTPKAISFRSMNMQTDSGVLTTRSQTKEARHDNMKRSRIASGKAVFNNPQQSSRSIFTVSFTFSWICRA